MKKIKNIFTLLLCLSILISSTMFVNASVIDENRLAYNEFYEIVTAAFAEKGKELIIEYDENHTYTQADIDGMLDFLENNEIIITVENLEKIEKSNSSRIMPATFDYVGSFRMNSSQLTSFAWFNIIVEGNIDLQGNNIMGYTSRDLVFRSGINYDSNTLTMRCSSSGSKITVNVSGYVMFSYTGIVTGLTYSVNDPCEYSVTFDALNYL